MKPWKTLNKQLIYDQSPWLVVEHHVVELPDGRVIPDWPWVTTPDYINVVVEMQTGEFLCFRQIKYALPRPTLALVGGYLQAGEAPMAAAKRELREETGCAAAEWIELGHYLVDPNRGMATGNLYLARGARRAAAEWIELGHYLVDPNRGMATGNLYLARGARRVGELIADDLEEQETVYLTRQELQAALDNGEFEVLAWAAAVALALSRLG
jgi:ADP-ribose pyrophosphatase